LLRQQWGPRTQGVMVATPSNPTGTSVHAAELAAMCRYVDERDGWCIVDEIYLGLQDGTPRTVLASDGDALVITSFSKYFGLTGGSAGAWCRGRRHQDADAPARVSGPARRHSVARSRSRRRLPRRRSRRAVLGPRGRNQDRILDRCRRRARPQRSSPSTYDAT